MQQDDQKTFGVLWVSLLRQWCSRKRPTMQTGGQATPPLHFLRRILNLRWSVLPMFQALLQELGEC